jgi:hypothetical protein
LAPENSPEMPFIDENFPKKKLKIEIFFCFFYVFWNTSPFFPFLYVSEMSDGIPSHGIPWDGMGWDGMGREIPSHGLGWDGMGMGSTFKLAWD